MESQTSFDLKGKTTVVLGVADKESIAWAIAKSFQRNGARVIIGYQRKFYSRVSTLLKDYPDIQAKQCDVLNPDEVEDFFCEFQSGGLDVLVHSIAYGPPAIFTQLPSEVNSAAFGETLEVSTHSFSKVIRFAKPYLNPWASVMTLTFQASQRAIPMYGMMGVAKAALESLVRYLSIELGPKRVRVNGLSAGPIGTLAALSEIVALRRNPEALEHFRGSAIVQVIQEVGQKRPLGGEGEFEIEFAKECWSRIQAEFAQRSAIPEALSSEDVAQSALFLASDLSRKITGQILHVDCGFSACQLI